MYKEKKYTEEVHGLTETITYLIIQVHSLRL